MGQDTRGFQGRETTMRRLAWLALGLALTAIAPPPGRAAAASSTRRSRSHSDPAAQPAAGRRPTRAVEPRAPGPHE